MTYGFRGVKWKDLWKLAAMPLELESFAVEIKVEAATKEKRTKMQRGQRTVERTH